ADDALMDVSFEPADRRDGSRDRFEVLTSCALEGRQPLLLGQFVADHRRDRAPVTDPRAAELGALARAEVRSQFVAPRGKRFLPVESVLVGERPDECAMARLDRSEIQDHAADIPEDRLVIHDEVTRRRDECLPTTDRIPGGNRSMRADNRWWHQYLLVCHR